MTKRVCAAAAALMLTLFLVSANAAVYAPSENSFSFAYPDEWLVDTLTYEATNTDKSLWLCDFHMNGCIIELDIENFADLYGTMSLFCADQAQTELYRQDIIDSYESYGESIECLETYEAVFENARIPFLIFQVTGSENGDFYYADTLANGWSITLYAYDDTEKTLAPECLEYLKTLLRGFTPSV